MSRIKDYLSYPPKSELEIFVPISSKVKNETIISIYSDRNWLQRVFNLNEKELIEKFWQRYKDLPLLAFQIGEIELEFQNYCTIIRTQPEDIHSQRNISLGSLRSQHQSPVNSQELYNLSNKRNADTDLGYSSYISSTSSSSKASNFTSSSRLTINSSSVNTGIPCNNPFSSVKIFVVSGVDALLLPFSRLVEGGIMQVASQFNALESPNPSITPISEYPYDRTQGPRAVMPCAHALIRRHVAKFNALQYIFPDIATMETYCKHGYLLWGRNPKAILKYISKHQVQKLLMLPMWVRPELGEEPLIQVFCAAPPIDAYGNSGSSAEQLEIARALVIPQYRAIAQLAAIKARATKATVSLHLTFVGGGAFNNPIEVLQEALYSAIETIKNQPVELYIHAFDWDTAQSRSRYLLSSTGIRVSENNIIRKDEFLRSLRRV